MKTILYYLILITFAIPAYGSSFSLQNLMQLFQQQPQLNARFRETKTDSYLQIPIIFSGSVHFKAPDYLKKVTEKPAYQSFELNGDRITIINRKQAAKNFMLTDYPQIKAFTASFMAFLSGDLETLRNYYSLILTGERAAWILTLEPLNKAVSRHIESIKFEGRMDRLLKVTTTQQSDDISLMEFFPTDSQTVQMHD